VILLENHGVPLATIEVDVRNGSFTQTPDFAGLAHMYEHMFFRANDAFPQPDAFADRASQLGAVFNGTTTEERVNYYLTLSSDSVAAGLHLMASALRDPLFRQDELERERQVVLGEYDRAESSPFFHLTTAIDAKLWPGAESRKNVIGDRDVVRTTTREKMQAIQHRYYVPNNTALIITGDIVPATAFSLAERVFGDWPRQDDPFAAMPIPPIRPLVRDEPVIVEEPVGDVVVLMQWHGPSVGADAQATYAADVFSDLVNLPGSALHQRLVDTGLFQSLAVNYYTLNHVGPISITGQTTPARLRDALAALNREIARFGDTTYFSLADLTAVKMQRTVSSAFGLERASTLAHTVGFWWSVASLDYFMGYVDNMAAQSRRDLARYASRYIVGQPRVTGVMLSVESRRAIALTPADLVGPRGGQ
jgi:zinc protease